MASVEAAGARRKAMLCQNGAGGTWGRWGDRPAVNALIFSPGAAKCCLLLLLWL